MLKVLISSSASDRLSAAAQFLSEFSPSIDIFIVGATRTAADDLVRQHSRGHRATFGLHRFSLAQLAARIAAGRLAATGQVPCSGLGAEAAVVRAVYEAERRSALQYFSPVALLPGFAKAARATSSELRGAGVGTGRLQSLPGPAPDVAALLEALDQQFTGAGLVDLPALLRMAAAIVRNNEVSPANTPLLLADVPIHSEAEYELVSALVGNAPSALMTVPVGDDRTLDFVGKLPKPIDSFRKFEDEDPALGRLRHYLFSEVKPPSGSRDDQVRIFSAPGEGRECVEIARRILEEARNGTRFDQMAVFLRSPATYSALLESAFRRAGIPGFFSFGTSRPDPAGRAFLAILACADERLSAKRFAEYLSLGQVPALDEEGAPPTGREVWAGPTDEVLGLGVAPTPLENQEAHEESADAQPDSEDSPQIGGTLRSPWNWERLLVEAAVIGGKDRWERRLNGLEAEFRLNLESAAAEDPEAPKTLAIERDRRQLAHLKNFALPLMEILSGLPERALWGEWLKILQSLAPSVLRWPERVLSTLIEMAPMEAVGPVSLFEVRNVLADRLTTLEVPRPAYRYGHVFVATTGQARCYSFDVVFIAGLAEQIFPQRPREDPILLDDLRGQIDAGLRNQAQRVSDERLLLRLCTGAARQRLYLSYPRLDVVQARPRVPSFYALDVERAVTGEVPDVETLEHEAGEEGSARLAWPAPADPNRAIDPVEHDLSVLRRLLSLPLKQSRGRARYLLELNGSMARSLRTRFARWNLKTWNSFDGLCAVKPETVQALAQFRLLARPYSASALQGYAACPYRFFLASIQRLEPRKEAASIEQLDPLTRGLILHRIQTELLRRLRDKNQLPVSPANFPDALRILDEVVRLVEGEYRENLFPAIVRVWNDEIDGLCTDLRLWLKRMAEDPSGWIPAHFELSFGISKSAQHEATDFSEAATIAGGFKLRGIIDLIEHRASDASLRVTDHKSGEDRTTAPLEVGGGEILQPALYSLAVESLMKKTVTEGRLYYCTAAGGFSERLVPLITRTRQRAEEVLKLIDNAIEHPFFPPAPREKICAWCDFQVVCGPYEEIRAKEKSQKPLAGLNWLRSLP